MCSSFWTVHFMLIVLPLQPELLFASFCFSEKPSLRFFAKAWFKDVEVKLQHLDIYVPISLTKFVFVDAVHVYNTGLLFFWGITDCQTQKTLVKSKHQLATKSLVCNTVCCDAQTCAIACLLDAFSCVCCRVSSAVFLNSCY